ncbi:VOC family protein [Streptococcus oricebi]|uniref:Glyoxalase-like domain-containing protein n=1 Tax=Streptococcus oricebi TaxID=1547447 RepID=A0ABS5B1X1_9STRE|nr:VOC family protein [Streptococcus oricebi]MBP2622831.1 hypothetical protein [Streptococcus oricebi]
MRSGHVIYKVDDLDQAVKEWRDKGFVVEYGRTENPINALIYFSEGAYIELLQTTGMPKIIQLIAKFFKPKNLEKFLYWENCPEGWCAFCIEKDCGDLEKEIAYLKENKIDGFYLKKGKREDTHGRTLNYKCFFTQGLDFPFLMSYFDVDPKPKDFVHPNGKRKIGHIKYYISAKYYDILRKLIDDDSLEIIKDNQRAGTFEISID